jgi:hypothetical protein
MDPRANSPLFGKEGVAPYEIIHHPSWSCSEAKTSAGRLEACICVRHQVCSMVALPGSYLWGLCLVRCSRAVVIFLIIRRR